MFDFIRKPQLWDAMDADWYEKIEKKSPYIFHIKTIQELVMYSIIKNTEFSKVGAISGGNPLLPLMACYNDCYNIETKGADGGSKSEINIPGVTNIKTFIGENGDFLENDFFDILFSISVVDNVPDDLLRDFFLDGVRILRPGGIMVHTINMYLADKPTSYWHNRFDIYKKELLDNEEIEPLGPVYDGPLKFACDFASNPDNIMHSWKNVAPALDELRQKAQSVSLIWGARKL